MAITFDPAKRARALIERGLDFIAAEVVFAGRTYTIQDLRADYGEMQLITVGLLDRRVVIVGGTPRGADRHAFSMRKVNDREQARYAALLA